MADHAIQKELSLTESIWSIHPVYLLQMKDKITAEVYPGMWL